jgi:heat shock protein HslJ
MRVMKNLILLLFSFLVFLILNCSSGKETTDIRLHDIWALESIEGEKIIIDETLKNLPMLEIYVEEERVQGNTSCNTINGKVKINGSEITFFDIIKTEMACPGNLEQRFLSALDKTSNYKIEKMRLHLFDDEQELLVFRKID